MRKELKDLTDKELWWRLKHTDSIEQIDNIDNELVNRGLIKKDKL